MYVQKVLHNSFTLISPLSLPQLMPDLFHWTRFLSLSSRSSIIIIGIELTKYHLLSSFKLTKFNGVSSLITYGFEMYSPSYLFLIIFITDLVYFL